MPKTNVVKKEEGKIAPHPGEPRLVPIVQVSGERVRKKKSNANLLFILTVFLPSLLGSVYFGLIATDRFVSEAKMTIRSPNGVTPNLLSGIMNPMGAGGSNSPESYVVRDYIKSPELVRQLDKELDLTNIFLGPGIDFFSRLQENSTQEDLHKYYLRRVSVQFDSTSMVISLKVEAFSSIDAKRLTERIVLLSENLVNNLSERSRNDALRFSQKEVELAESRLSSIRIQIYNFRSKHGVLDPELAAISFGSIIAGLETELVKLRTQLASGRVSLKENNPRIIDLKSKISAIVAQIAIQKVKLTDRKLPSGMSSILSRFEELKIKEEFAKSSYALAITAMEMARAEALKKQMYLVTFVKPLAAQKSVEPRRLVMIFSTIVISLIIFGISALLLATIREHARA